MCGISGVFGAGDTPAVKRMLGKLVHRGPDDELSVGGLEFALGARRLSIVDVEGGRQPLSNERATVWATQNGELYNFATLREQLIKRGHRLHTLCDTEVLPHLYEEYGSALPEHIDGMFAVAVWDDERKTGLLARDRTGKKPLYYHRRKSDGALYFASELKALLTLDDVSRDIDLEALHHFLSFKHVPHPHSIFRDIRILPPGHVLTYRAGSEPAIHRYWRLRFESAPELLEASEDELVEKLLGLLREGVHRRLMSDVPVGFLLSGGIDSSLSTALAAELSSGPIKTFTLAYDAGSTTEGKEQDRRWARWAAARYGTESHEETIGAVNYAEKIRDILACFDEPFAGVVSTYFLSALIARHVKVAVSGDGADELFGSYLSHRLAGPVARYPEYCATGDPALIAPFEQADQLSGMAGQEDWQWRSELLVFTEAEKQRLYTSGTARETAGFSTPELLHAVFSRLTAREPVNRMLEAEFHTILPDQVLTFVDRLSMAHSLEVRTAYLDTDVLSFVAALPDRMKIRAGETKYLLKKAALRYFPAEMVFRKKEGFVMPVTDWLSDGLQGYVRQVLSPARLGRHGLFDVGEVGRLVEDMDANRGDYRRANKVLALITFQEWHDLYVV